MLIGVSRRAVMHLGTRLSRDRRAMRGHDRQDINTSHPSRHAYLGHPPPHEIGLSGTRSVMLLGNGLYALVDSFT